jgi:hypothetical protein
MPSYDFVSSVWGVGNLVGGHEPYYDILEEPQEDLAMDRWEGRPDARGGTSPPRRRVSTVGWRDSSTQA